MKPFNQPGKATTTRTTFSRETSVNINISASSSVVWNLLTSASRFPAWNSTIISIEGKIAQGETIRLKSVLDAKRVFKLRIKKFDPNKLLVWGDGQGNRVYSIRENNDGTVTFFMTEKIGGLMFPLYAKMIPPFDNSFEQFARDLKSTAEAK